MACIRDSRSTRDMPILDNSATEKGKQRMTDKPKLGRPPSLRGIGNWLPPRQLGRVSDEDWSVIREACEVSGQSLVEWGLPLLLREARKLIQKNNPNS